MIRVIAFAISMLLSFLIIINDLMNNALSLATAGFGSYFIISTFEVYDGLKKLKEKNK